MKYLLILVLSTGLFSQKYSYKHDDNCRYCDDDEFNITWKNHEFEKSGMAVYERGRQLFEIKHAGDLYVRGKRIETTKEQSKMFRLYVNHFEIIIDEGIQIGLDGADIGLAAASEAIKAVFSFNIDKMERILEDMEEEIERKAEKLELEERAEELEYHAEEFIAIRCILKREIRELKYLDEF